MAAALMRVEVIMLRLWLSVFSVNFISKFLLLEVLLCFSCLSTLEFLEICNVPVQNPMRNLLEGLLCFFSSPDLELLDIGMSPLKIV